jgi:hypothetical protein
VNVPIRWIRRLVIVLRVLIEISERVHEGTTENCRQLKEVADDLTTTQMGDPL